MLGLISVAVLVSNLHARGNMGDIIIWVASILSLSYMQSMKTIKLIGLKVAQLTEILRVMDWDPIPSGDA